jgi:site-specific DNA recombinase
MEQIAREGGYLGGPRPFGYRDGGMELEPTEVALIAEGIRMILRGRSLRSVVKLWNEAGTITTMKGNTWEPATVRDALMRDRNAGLLQHRGRVVGSARWPRSCQRTSGGACARP